jgi:hypothetical protein
VVTPQNPEDLIMTTATTTPAAAAVLGETTQHRTPRNWPDAVAAAALSYVTRKTFFDFTGPAATRDAGEEGAEEIAAATIFRVMAGPDIPAGVPLKRWLARACRYSRLTRGYDSGLERKRERHHLELEEALSGPYQGASMDARQVDPARALAAAEDAAQNGITEVIPHHASERMKYRKTRRTYHYQTMRGGPIYRRVVILGAVWHKVQIATQITIEKTARSPEDWTGTRWNNHAEATHQHWLAEKAEVAAARLEQRPAEPIPFPATVGRRQANPVDAMPFPYARHADRTELLWNWIGTVTVAARGMPSERYRHVPEPMPQPIPSTEPSRPIVSVDARRGWVVTADWDAYTPELRYPGSRVTDATPEQLEQRQREYLDAKLQ